MFKFVKGLIPEVMLEIFQFREEYHYKLRSKASLHIPLVSTVFNGRGSIRFLVPKIWESTPNELKSLQSLHEFKIAIKK